MTQIITYLTFNGNCKEAMKFYQQCLGGELQFQTVSESAKTDQLPKRMKSHITQASLKRDNLVLMATDMMYERPLQGNSVSILLDCTDEDQINVYYQNLEAVGKVTHAIQETHSGDLLGGLTDKFGNHWLFHCKRKRQFKTRGNG